MFFFCGRGSDFYMQPRSKSIEAFGNCLGPYCRTLRRNSRQGKIKTKKTKKKSNKNTILQASQFFTHGKLLTIILIFVKSGVNDLKEKNMLYIDI